MLEVRREIVRREIEFEGRRETYVASRVEEEGRERREQ